jgi:large subunit ribosomal protein L1
MSFSDENLLDNLRTLIETVLKAKPAAAKGKYVKSIAISSTMGPGIRIDPNAVGAK